KAPGATRDGHGAMLVRNIRAIADDAMIFDCPVIPERIPNIPSFLNDLHAAYNRMFTDIETWRSMGQYLGPWVFVNAWAILDRKSEVPLGDYTENPQNWFNRLVEHRALQGFDFVFGAGNCGQFCPDRRCGATDRGPGKSIYGANSSAGVL